MRATGDTTNTQYTANSDGKDYPVKGSPTVEKVSLKMKDARTVDRWDKKGGQVVQQFTRKVSADGKTMMVTQRATDAAGKSFENTMLFERQ